MSRDDQDPHIEYRLGVDVGGTFTDLVLLDDSTGILSFEKALTTPTDPSIGVLSGVEKLLTATGTDAKEILHVIHATTLIGNAIIEHKGAKTALITTNGFKDILTLGREFRYDIYESHLTFPKPMVPRRWRFELMERMSAGGAPILALEDSEIVRATDWLVEGEFDAVAVCLLHSYVNPSHERKLAEAIRDRAPGVEVSTSSDVLSQVGEFERSVAVTINAFAQPLTEAYIGRLELSLRELGFKGELYLLSSNGGLMTGKTAQRFPVRLLESGPVAGALGSALYGKAIGYEQILSFDMGGTTAKACVIADGTPALTNEFEVARERRLTKGSGLPIKLPAVDMLEIGAGGGSIARLNEVRLIEVGPDSAGANPGPASYGLEGAHPTVTDANLLLGYLNSEYFLGGEMSLDLAAAERVLAKLGEEAELSAIRAAWGVHEIISQSMANALKTHAIEKGVDYRKFALFAFGGAGPTHAYRIATLLGINTIIVPWGAGVFSAVGMLSAPLQFDLTRTVPTELMAIEWDVVRKAYNEMETELMALFSEAGMQQDDLTLSRSADMRYVGQGNLIEVPLPDPAVREWNQAGFRKSFEAAYGEQYGWSLAQAPAQVMNWRLQAHGPSPDVSLATRAADGGGNPEKESRRVYLDDQKGFQPCPVFDRYLLAAGQAISGPAVIEERECTIFVGSDATAKVDESGMLIITLEGTQ